MCKDFIFVYMQIVLLKLQGECEPVSGVVVADAALPVFGSEVELVAAVKAERASLIEDLVREVSAGKGSVAQLRIEERMSKDTVAL